MITDRSGQGEVLLTINHDYNKISDVLALLKIKKKTQEIQRVFLLAWKKSHLSVRAVACTVQLHRSMTHAVLLHF